MKKPSIILLSLLLTIMPLFAGGSPEQYIQALNDAGLVGEKKETDAITTDMATIESLYRYVDSSYYEDVDKKAVKENLAKALLDSLGDKYSFYIPADEANDYNEEVTGSYGGIGIYLSKPNPNGIDKDDPKTYMITIESVMPNTPAQRSGLRSHDLVSAINGERVDNMTSSEASKLLRGEAGSDVTITVQRNSQEFEVTLTREKIDKKVLEWTMLGNNIGYVAINSYSSTISDQLLKALRELKSQGMKALIIDERYNGGGNVDECMKCANMFLPSGKTIVSLQQKKGTQGNEKYTATGNQQINGDIPIVILVNGGSASSSEIFAAALHDNGRATLIGSKTFGKGIFQVVFPFDDGYVQLTTGHYYTPNGICIHGTGIEPDIEAKDIDFSEEELPLYEKMLKDKTIPTFVDEHKDFTEENIQAFVEQQKDSGIRPEVLRLLARTEYVARMDYDDQPITDPAYDVALKRAITYLETGK